VRKYQFDLFFRTECRIIALQLAFTLFILLIVSGAFSYLYDDMTASLTLGVKNGISAKSATLMGETIAKQMEYAKTKNLIAVTTLVVLVASIFGYIIARITLKPTRDALSSQKQFIGNVAHELRTPLAIIKTNTEVALFDQSLGEKLKHTLRSNVEELDRASDIINNLVSLNVLVRPERIHFGNVDLGMIVENVVRKLAPLAAQRELEITVRKSEFRLVWGNATALEQIAMNLLKNAIIYTSPGGRITLTIVPTYRGDIELTVQDSGIGIARKDLFRILEPFYRADHSRARKQGGSGLGLTIVSELVKLHSGKLNIKSALKQGTTVLISLPCGNTAESEIRLASGESKDHGEIAIDFSNRKPHPKTT